MLTSGAVGWQKACGPVVPVFPDETSRRPSAPRRVARSHEERFLLAGFLVILAACLAVGFAAYIVLEAFDSDPKLWPSGTQDFNTALQKLIETDLQSVCVLSGLTAILRLVATAGADLILSHRARSALAADSPTIPIPSNVAEPWWSYMMVTPALGHPVSWTQAIAASYADERRRRMGARSRARCLS